MKNIHRLVTVDKTDIGYTFVYGETVLKQFSKCNKELQGRFSKFFHIYITSNEEIKEGDCCIDTKRNIIFQSKKTEIGTSKKIPIIICTYEGCYIKKDCKKIILTTDQDLIKDGVQAIDDEFLEWFVKNPSCEEVDFEVVDDNIQWYKITIPRKNFYCGDEVDYGDKCSEQCVQCVNATGVDYGYLPEEKPKYPIGGYAPGNYMCNCCTCKKQFIGDKRAVQCEPCAIEMTKEEPKQETLEEAAELFFRKKDAKNCTLYKAAKFGAKWQQGRSYSEEEVISLLYIRSMCQEHYESDAEIREWFNKFKKK